jgi:hypothetical protein
VGEQLHKGVGKNVVLESLTGSVYTEYTRIWRRYGLEKRMSSSVSVRGQVKVVRF